MKLKSIQFKIALWAGACLVLAATVFISYSAYHTRRLAIEAAQKEALAVATGQAAQIQAQLAAALDITRALSQSIKAAKVSRDAATLSRPEINAMLRQVLIENPDFLAIYSSWEPNVFDGQDAQYANKPGYNGTGRFNTTFSRNENGDIEADATGDNEEDAQDWYQQPKKNLGDTILDPYLYPVQGKDTLETSLLSPIVIEGKFYGLIGIDMRIDSLQQRADQFKLYDQTAHLYIISNNGTVAAATQQPGLVNQTVLKSLPQFTAYLPFIKEGNQAIQFLDDDLVVAAPFTVGATKTPWSVILQIPRSQITYPAFKQLSAQVILGVVMVLAALLFLWWLARRLAAPIRAAARAAQQLSEGILPDVLPVQSADETGQLAQAMNQMTAYLREMADTADHIAQGDLAVKVQPRSVQDRFGHSFRNMADYLQDMAQISDHIAGGDLGVQVVPKSEQDRFGHSFRDMLERTLVLVQSQEERDHIQTSIMKLLDEVAEVSTGDLTVQAEVSADMTGAIADAFNMMIGELRGIINRVKDTTWQVNRSAEQINLATTELASGSEFQATQISHTSEAVQTMAASIQEVSRSAAQSALVAQSALDSSRKGSEIVLNNISAMGRIREQVQETAKRIKRLGERSQEIGNSVQMIQDIADRTSMLALNAAIQAANAGAEGRGFVVVAEEIESLAERASSVTKQIETLIQNIQGETTEVVAAMEDMTSKVVHGSALAGETGTALQEIEAVAQQLAGLIKSIAQASQQQAQGSEAVTQAMSHVSRVTQQIELGTNRVASSARQLVSQAEELRGSVVAFKLPVKPSTNIAELSPTLQVASYQ